MKKNIIFLLLIFGFTVNCAIAGVANVKDSDYTIVTQSESLSESDGEIVEENEYVKIIKRNDKFYIKDKTTDTFISSQYFDDISQFAPNNDKEYKVKLKNLTGYLNAENKKFFLSDYDDLYLIGKYLKSKKDNKVGIIDKDGGIILNTVFEKANVIYDDNKEYFKGTLDGKVMLFYNTGKLVSEKEYYSVPTYKNNLLTQDLKPVLKYYRKNGNMVYNKPQNENYTEQAVYEIHQIPLKNKVQIAAIERNESPDFLSSDDNNKIIIGKREFVIKKDKNKIGLDNENGKEIIPVAYNKLNVKKPCEHSSYYVIAAEKNHSYTLYNLNGKVAAEQIYNKINIYKYGKVYTYSFEDNDWVLRVNNKKIGVLTYDDGDYNFTKSSFHLYSLHKINELMVTLLTMK